MMNPEPDYEVAVIGGGPAGSALAGYLARGGLRVVVLEKAIFPRFHVGESLVPAANRVLRELGLMETMEAAGFPRKFGASWTSALSKFGSADFGRLSHDWRADIAFKERELHGEREEYTYHVDRAKFDHILLDRAAELGAEIRQGVRVTAVEFPEDEFVRIKIASGDGDRTLRVRLAADASGRRTLLGRQLGLKIDDPCFNQYALHTWFEDFDRGQGVDQDYIHVHFLPRTGSWIWQIPITDTVTSFGVVTQKEYFESRSSEREAFFWESVKTRPEIYERLRAARRLREFTAEGDYSYAMKRIVGRGFVLIGDAARFVDPIFSSGVSVALNSARMAADAIGRALGRDDPPRVLDESHFLDYARLMKAGTRNWYEFITLYYRLNVLFTHFVQDDRYRLDVLQLLQGDVYDEEEPRVLKEMRRVVSVVESNPNHVWHGMLGDLRSGLVQVGAGGA